MDRLKTYYLETYGCQMNFSDSELVESLLSQAGLEPAGGADQADLILLNTCGVREHAEQRVLSRINQLKARKEKSPHKLLAVIGCMAQRIGTDILARAPWVDLVVGPDGYRKIPELISQLCRNEHLQLSSLDFVSSETYDDLFPELGCNQF